MTRRTNTAPLRRVTRARLGEGAVTFVRQFRARWWELDLECGHYVERSARYEKGAAGGRGFAALHHPAPLNKVLDPPERVRCRACQRDADDG